MAQMEQPLDLTNRSLELGDRVPRQIRIGDAVGKLIMADEHVFRTYRFELPNGHQIDVSLRPGGIGTATIFFPTSGHSELRSMTADGVTKTLRWMGNLKTDPYSHASMPRPSLPFGEE